MYQSTLLVGSASQALRSIAVNKDISSIFLLFIRLPLVYVSYKLYVYCLLSFK